MHPKVNIHAPCTCNQNSTANCTVLVSSFQTPIVSLHVNIISVSLSSGSGFLLVCLLWWMPNIALIFCLGHVCKIIANISVFTQGMQRTLYKCLRTEKIYKSLWIPAKLSVRYFKIVRLSVNCMFLHSICLVGDYLGNNLFFLPNIVMLLLAYGLTKGNLYGRKITGIIYQ